MDNHNQFMRRAIQLAVDNVRNGHGGPFGAVVVKDGRIVGEGANSVTAANDPTAHAEVVAIRNACELLGSFQLDGCDLYTSCEPCPMCLGAIYWARPERIFYCGTSKDATEAGFDDSFIYREMLIEPGTRRIPMQRMLPEEAAVSFNEWKKSPTKVQY